MARENDDVRSMYDKKHLGAWDLDGRDVTVEIAKVTRGELKNKAGTDKKPIVHFRGTEKTLPLNVTTRDIVAGMYGYKAKDWVGKCVTLYPTQVPFGPRTIDAIRVRPKVPDARRKVEGIESRPVDPEMRAKQDEAAELASGENPAAERQPGEEG